MNTETGNNETTNADTTQETTETTSLTNETINQATESGETPSAQTIDPETKKMIDSARMTAQHKAQQELFKLAGAKNQSEFKAFIEKAERLSKEIEGKLTMEQKYSELQLEHQALKEKAIQYENDIIILGYESILRDRGYSGPNVPILARGLASQVTDTVDFIAVLDEYEKNNTSSNNHRQRMAGISMGTANSNNVTKEQFTSMTFAEKKKFSETNPELYRKYTNERK